QANPPANGQANPPANGQANPPANGQANPPANGQANPPADGQANPPANGQANPPANGQANPPANGQANGNGQANPVNSNGQQNPVAQPGQPNGNGQQNPTQDRPSAEEQSQAIRGWADGQVQLLSANGSEYAHGSLGYRVETAGMNGPITAQQAADFQKELDAQVPPTNSAERAKFDQNQQEMRALLAEAQTPLMAQRLGIQRDSQQLNASLGQFAQLEGMTVGNNFSELESRMNGGRPVSPFSPPPSALDYSAQERERYGALASEITLQARQDLRDGRPTTQVFGREMDQVKNADDAKVLMRANQAGQDAQMFPNFSGQLSSLEARQRELNQAYEAQGLDRRSQSQDLASVRQQMEAMDAAIVDRGKKLSRQAGQLSVGQAFDSAPVDQSMNRPSTQQLPFSFAGNGEIQLVRPGQAVSAPGGNQPPSPALQKELKGYQDLRSRGIAPGDIQMSPELRQHLGLPPGQGQPSQFGNPFENRRDKPAVYGDARGADFSQANLQAYNTQGDIYDQNTVFPPGYSPQMNGMVRQNSATENYQTHIGTQPEGLQRQFATRTLEANGQYPNPDYQAGNANTPATVDASTFAERYTQRQSAQIDRQFASERDYVTQNGGYDAAAAKLKKQAEAKYPSGGQGSQGRGRQVQAEYERLMKENMPHYFAAQQQAQADLQSQARETFRQQYGVDPPTGGARTGPRASAQDNAQNRQWNAYQAEVQRLSREQLAGMREDGVREAQRKELQSAANIDRDELDREWARVGDQQLQQAAGQAWDSMSVDERRGVMGTVASERIQMARYETGRLMQTGSQQRPEDAGRLGEWQQKSDQRLEQLEQDLKAGKVEEVEAALRRDVVPGSAQISYTDLMDNYSAPGDRMMDKSFEQKTAEATAQREAAYQQNGWWEDSPFYGVNNGAFMQDLQDRDMRAISPTDAARGLSTLEQMREQNQLDSGAYDAMKSKLSRAYDLGRVGQQTAALDREFRQVVDDQGIVGDFADGVKNELGRPGGWVIDSNLGSRAIGNQIGGAIQSRQAIMDMANFQGTDAEFRQEYEKRLGKLRGELGGIEQRIGEYKTSQENWVEGISDVASVSAGLALAPVTGGASLVAAPLAGGLTKVGVKALEAGTGSGQYQGNIATDFFKGGVNAMSALGTSRAAALAEKTLLAGRSAGAGTWLAARGLNAVEGAADGYGSTFAGAVIDGNSLGEAHEKAKMGAAVGGVLGPAFGTAGDAASRLRAPKVDAPVPHGGEAPAGGFSPETSKLRLDSDNLRSEAAAYLQSRGLDPNMLDGVDIGTGNVAQTITENGRSQIQLPVDSNGRVSAHEFGHELDHAVLAQQAAGGDAAASAALSQADAAYGKLRQLREQGASPEQIAEARQAYESSLAEHRAEAGGHDFVANYFDRLKSQPKPKTGQPQDVAALSRLEDGQIRARQAQEAAAADAVPPTGPANDSAVLGRDVPPKRQAKIEKALKAGSKEEAVRLSREAGIAYRALNGNDIANILDGNGIPARGPDGSPDALEATVFADGSAKARSSKYTPTTETHPRFLNDDQNFAVLDTQGMPGRYLPQEKMPKTGAERDAWVKQQEHSAAVGDIRQSDLHEVTLGGQRYSADELQDLVGRVQKYDSGVVDGDTVHLTQSEPPYGHTELPVSELPRKGLDMGNLDNTSFYYDPTPPGGGPGRVVHTVDGPRPVEQGRPARLGRDVDDGPANQRFDFNDPQSKLLKDENLRKELGQAYAGADQATRQSMRDDMQTMLTREAAQLKDQLKTDPFLKEQLSERVGQLTQVAEQVGSGEAARELFDPILAGTQDMKLSKAVNPNQTVDGFVNGPTTIKERLTGKRPPPFVGKQQSWDEHQQLVDQMLESVDRYAGRREVPTGGGITKKIDDMVFAQGAPGPVVNWGKTKQAINGFKDGQEVLEIPINGGESFKYLLMDGNHRTAGAMLAGDQLVEPGRVHTLSDIGLLGLDRGMVENMIRRHTTHLYITDYHVAR
ncbi:MAG: hypothetical protein AB7S38_39365, partial [Vulcanimicrobiota bacterium]